MSQFCWLGNELCLDFHNTASWRAGDGAHQERLPDFASLSGWCEEAGLLGEGEGEGHTRSTGSKAQAAALSQARALRALLHRLFTPLTDGGIPDAADVAAFNDYLASVVMTVDWFEGESPVMSPATAGELDPLLSPVVWSAASLLVSPYRDQIGRCSNPECGWLFVDLSRRGNRRWCDMKTCGNREKARRHYQKSAAD
jgi:predicted RNA-binding Zn ribbon-like protein